MGLRGLAHVLMVGRKRAEWCYGRNEKAHANQVQGQPQGGDYCLLIPFSHCPLQQEGIKTSALDSLIPNAVNRKTMENAKLSHCLYPKFCNNS